MFEARALQQRHTVIRSILSPTTKCAEAVPLSDTDTSHMSWTSCVCKRHAGFIHINNAARPSSQHNPMQPHRPIPHQLYLTIHSSLFFEKKGNPKVGSKSVPKTGTTFIHYNYSGPKNGAKKWPHKWAPNRTTF